MAVPLKIRDLEFNFPTSWDDLTLGQFFALRSVQLEKDNDLIDVLEAVTDVPRKTWDQCKEIHLDKKIIPYLKFTKKEPNYGKGERLKVLILESGSYKVPEDLGLETFGQKVTLEQELKGRLEPTDNIQDLQPFALCCYFYPIITGEEFDPDKCEKVMSDIMTARAKDAIPIADFFLRKLSDYLSGITRS